MFGSSLFSQPLGRLGEGMVLGLEGWDSDTVTYHVNIQCLYYVTERPSYIENRIYTVRYHSESVILQCHYLSLRDHPSYRIRNCNTAQCTLILVHVLQHLYHRETFLHKDSATVTYTCRYQISVVNFLKNLMVLIITTELRESKVNQFKTNVSFCMP